MGSGYECVAAGGCGGHARVHPGKHGLPAGMRRVRGSEIPAVWLCLNLEPHHTLHTIYFFGGLIMMWAPAVPGYISQGALSLGLVDSPVDSGVAKGT